MTEGASPENRKGQLGIAQAALFGLCPRCSERTVFAAPARIADECSACNLPLSELEGGGRFVGLLTMIVALVLIGIAILIEDTWRPPLLLQMAVWLPITIGAVLGTLRLYKIVNLYARFERRLSGSKDDA